MADTVTPEFLARFGAAWNDHNVETILEHMTEDCVFMSSVGESADGSRWVGREAVRHGVNAFFTAYPDAHFETLGGFIAGQRGVSEWLFTATRRDGVAIRSRGCDLFTFADGKIQVKDAFRKQTP